MGEPDAPGGERAEVGKAHGGAAAPSPSPFAEPAGATAVPSGQASAGEAGSAEPAGATAVPSGQAPARGPVIPPPAASLGPFDRVIPTWTDPMVRRASAAIGGPLGRHASVGRARIFTPLRVALLMGIAVLICGWLFKSPCIQTGADGGLDQGGQRPWITGCYNDVVPLYAARGLNDASSNPYAYVWTEWPDGSTGRVFPRSAVQEHDGVLVVREAGTTVPVGQKDLVGSPESGYSTVKDGALTPLPADQLGAIHHLEYPVLTGYFMWGAAALTSGYLAFAESTHVLPVPLDVAAYFTIGAILLSLFYLWAIASTARIARRRIWDTAIMCAAPLLVVHAFTNWDLLPIGFTAAAMLAWARRRPGLAGILLGLGIAAKLYPVLLLGPLLVLCLRTGKMRSWFKSAAWAAVVWAAINAPIFVSYPQAWAEFFKLNATRGPEWGSWYFLSTVVSRFNPWADAAQHATPLLNGLSLALFVLACAAIGWFALSARRRPRFAQLAFLVVAAFLLTNKVWSPQYSLWLVPLVALALPRWRRVLPWQFAEVAVWMLLMLSFSTDAGKNLSIHPFAAAAVIRDILLIALVVRVVREAMRPELDLIRQAGDDDPSGGVLEGAADRFTVPSLPDLVRRRAGRRRGRNSSTPAGVVISADLGSDAASIADGAVAGGR